MKTTHWGLLVVAAVLVLATFLVSSTTRTEAAGPTSLGRTPWQVLPAAGFATNPSPGGHGNVGEYAAAPAIPPANDPSWLPCGPGSPLRASPYAATQPLCPNSSTIGMVVGSRLPGCMTQLDFTLFQTLVDIPLGTTLSTFSIAFSGMDDGARVTIFNSANPGGLVITGSYVFLGGTGTTNLAPYVVAGETNRVVVTQVDDCAVGNNLQSAVVNLNGTVVPPVPTADLSISKGAPPTAVVGTQFTYNINVQNSGPASAPAIVIQDMLPPSVKFISASPSCTHNGALTGGSVTCSGVSVPAGGNVPLSIAVQAMTTGTALNNVAITNLGANLIDPNQANNQAQASTVINAPPAPPAPPFANPGPNLGADLCMPLYMDQDLQKQYWWARAAGGALQINFSAVGVNASEAGTATVNVVAPGGTTVATHTVSYAGLATVSAPPVVVPSAVAGSLYRIEVQVAAPPTGPVARHYRVSASGATLIGTNSPLQPQGEHDDVRWRVNVDGAGLHLVVAPAPEAPLTSGTMVIIDPSGAVAATLPLTAAGQTYADPGATSGQWIVAIRNADGHYILSKTSGGDRGLYLGWDASGSGSLTGSVTRVGVPNTVPVTIHVDGLTLSGVLGSFSVPQLPVGKYTVSIDGTSVTGNVTVTCNGTASITLDIPNSPPIAEDDSASTSEDSPVTVAILTNDADVDGHPLTITSVGTAANGTVAVSGGIVTYTPNPNYHGSDSFTYEISDGNGGSDTATVTITVLPVNDPPVAVDDSASTTAGTAVSVTVLSNDTDIDGDVLFVSSVGSPGNGDAVVNPDGTITYTPAPGFAGDDTFQYTVSDGNGGSATATVTVHVDQFSGTGRMTGGGTVSVGNGRNAQRQTWGFTLYCDGSKGNLEFNDHVTGGRFHLEQVLTTVCNDDPAIIQRPPDAPLDTLYVAGRGRWNNVSGAIIEATFVDAGEPGTVDSVRLTVWNASGVVVASISGQLTGGNHQAHR